MRQSGVEVQATASDEGLWLAVPSAVSLRAGDLPSLVSKSELVALLHEAVLEVPMFLIRWRHVASRSLLVPRMRAGKRVPPHIQRSNADELLLSVMPSRITALATHENRLPILHANGTQGNEERNFVQLEHPLLRQTIHDCNNVIMDIEGLQTLISRIESGSVSVRVKTSKVPSIAARGLLSAKPPSFLDGGALMDRKTRNFLPAPKHLEIESDIRILPEAIDIVASQLKPSMKHRAELIDAITLAGVLTASELEGTKCLADELKAHGRLLEFKTKHGVDLWISADRASEIAAVYDVELHVPHSTDRNEAIVRLLRSRLEVSCPVSAECLSKSLGLSLDLVKHGLARLSDSDEILSGAFYVSNPNTQLWCDRRILSRVNQLTRSQLRAEVEPVSKQMLFNFMLRWTGLSHGDKKRGRDGLVSILESLDGASMPAAAWLGSVLPNRIHEWSPELLTQVCLTGRFRWGRLFCKANTGKPSKLMRTTPIAFSKTEHWTTWRGLAGSPPEDFRLSQHAHAIYAELSQRGAMFVQNLMDQVRLPHFQYELAIDELTSLGLITSDSFAGVTSLLEKPASPTLSRLDMIERNNAGRWSTLTVTKPIADPIERDAAIQTYAQVLLKRYGIIVRDVILREELRVGWVELVRTLRRMEARGDVRGGYLAEGLSGEQFALPEALALLRETLRGPLELDFKISAADVFNLTGILTKDREASRLNETVQL